MVKRIQTFCGLLWTLKGVMIIFVETAIGAYFGLSSNSGNLIRKNYGEIAIPAIWIARKAFFDTLRLYLS